jgi:hypothetical protein
MFYFIDDIILLILKLKHLAEVINKLIFNNIHQQNILIQSLTFYTQNNCSIWCWWTTVEVYEIAKMYIEYVVYSSVRHYFIKK